MTKHRNSSQERTILDATLEVIAEHKISGTRMRQIAASAQMSQGNLHYYFPSKAQLFIALLDNILKSFVEERAAQLNDMGLEPKEMLSVFFHQEKQILEQHRNFKDVLFDFWVQGTKDPIIAHKYRNMYATWRRDISKVISRGVERGMFYTTYVDLIPNLMLSLMEGAALQYLIDSDSIDLDAYFTTAERMVLDLLTTP